MRVIQTILNSLFAVNYMNPGQPSFKLECLGIANKLNPLALCRKVLINASRTAYAQLQLFRAAA